MKKYLFVFATILILSANVSWGQELKWKIFGDLIEARHFFQALPINDSTILVMGGYKGEKYMGYQELNSCELININSKTVTQAAPMKFARAEFKALLTKDSNVIVLGGALDNLGLTEVEFYDRQLNQWTYLGKMNHRRMQLSAVFINDEEILITGGRDNASSPGTKYSEIFNYEHQSSTNVQDFPIVGTGGTLAKTSDGEIWGYGFRQSGAGSSRSDKVYKYNIIMNKWEEITKLKNSVQNIPYCYTMKGKLVSTNGSIDENFLTHSDQVLIENNGKFENRMQSIVRTQWHVLAPIFENSVIRIGGINEKNIDQNTTEIFDFDKNIVTDGPKMNFARNASQACSFDLKGKMNYIIAIGGCINGYSESIKSIEYLDYENSNFLNLVSQFNDCETKEYKFEAKPDIELIKLISSENIIGNWDQLPTGIANVKLKLIDKSKNGYYTLYVRNLDGTSLVIKDSITSISSSIELSALEIINENIDAGELDEDEKKCFDVVITNSGSKDIVINSVKFKNGGVFTAYVEGLPMLLKSKKSDVINVCVESAASGLFVDSLIIEDLCNQFFMPAVVKFNNPFFRIDELENDCGRLIFEINSNKELTDILLNSSSYNTKIQVLSNLPSKKVKVVLSLIDQSNNGYYDLIIFDKLNGKEKKTGYLSSIGGSLTIISPLDSLGFYNFNNTKLTNSSTESILICNMGSRNIIIDSVYMFYNVYFSTNKSQYPIVVNVGDTVELFVTYKPDSLNIKKDSLLIIGDCLYQKIKLKGKGIENFYSNQTKCNSILNMTSFKLNTKISGPYPNPTNQLTSIVLLDYDDESEIKVLNVLGEEAEFSIVQKYKEKDSTILILDLSRNESGIYLISDSYGGLIGVVSLSK